MKILVTGTGGFVGPHLIRELAAAGHTVQATDIYEHPSDGLPLESFTLCDLSDSKDTAAMLKELKPDAIIHLAGWSHVGASWDNPAEVIELNLVTTLHLYESASDHLAPGSRFLFISSADVYGAVQPHQLPLDEESPVAPASPYAVSKYSAELVLEMVHTKSHVDLLMVRPFNHIGPGQSLKFACPDFARQIAEIQAGRRDVLRHGNLESKRDFLDVRDVCNAYRLVLEKAPAGELYVIAGGVSVSMDWIVRRLFHFAGIEPRMELDSKRLRASDTPDLRGSAAKLKRVVGWRPKYDYDTTLSEILEEARATL